MKKKKTNSMGVLGIAIVIILLGVVGVYLLRDKNVSFNQGENTDTTFDSVAERDSFNQDLKEIESSLGFIAILTSIDKYNAGGDYVTKKDVNLLEDNKEKQLFVMEQIVRNTENDKNFVILNMNGEVDKEITTPTTEGSIAYYPASLFESVYHKYFEGNFSIEQREVSSYQNKYDQDSNYVYYNNRRAGMNGLTVSSITVEKVEKSSDGMYLAHITLHYSSRAVELLSVDSDTAELVYQRDEDGIKIQSYMIK